MVEFNLNMDLLETEWGSWHSYLQTALVHMRYTFHAGTFRRLQMTTWWCSLGLPSRAESPYLTQLRSLKILPISVNVSPRGSPSSVASHR